MNSLYKMLIFSFFWFNDKNTFSWTVEPKNFLVQLLSNYIKSVLLIAISSLVWDNSVVQHPTACWYNQQLTIILVSIIVPLFICNTNRFIHVIPAFLSPHPKSYGQCTLHWPVRRVGDRDLIIDCGFIYCRVKNNPERTPHRQKWDGDTQGRYLAISLKFKLDRSLMDHYVMEQRQGRGRAK